RRAPFLRRLTCETLEVHFARPRLAARCAHRGRPGGGPEGKSTRADAAQAATGAEGTRGGGAEGLRDDCPERRGAGGDLQGGPVEGPQAPPLRDLQRRLPP